MKVRFDMMHGYSWRPILARPRKKKKRKEANLKENLPTAAYNTTGDGITGDISHRTTKP